MYWSISRVSRGVADGVEVEVVSSEPMDEAMLAAASRFEQ